MPWEREYVAGCNRGLSVKWTISPRHGGVELLQGGLPVNGCQKSERTVRIHVYGMSKP